MTTTRRPRPAKSVDDRIKPLSARPIRFRGIIYGEPGNGKTTLAASSSELGRTLIINADRQDSLEAARTFGYNPDVFDVTKHSELEEIWNDLRHGTLDYEWVWLDTGTLYQENLMEEVLAEVVAAKPHRDPDVPDKPEYLRTQVKLQKWVRHMRGLKINWGITAHVMGIQDEDGDVRYMPAFQGGRGALSSKLCGYVGVVGRLHMQRVKVKKEGKTRTVVRRTLQVQPEDKYYAKDGFNVLGTEIIRPTMAQIMESINRKGSVK